MVSSFGKTGHVTAALLMSVSLGVAGCASKPDPAALELLRQQQAAEAARQKAADTQRAADKAFENLDRDTR